MGNPKGAVLLHLALSGSQSEHGVWFILPTRGACHIMRNVIAFNQVPNLIFLASYDLKTAKLP